MKKLIFLFLLLIFSSCSIDNKENQILELNNTISKQQLEIEKLQKKDLLKNKIEKYKYLAYEKREQKLREEIKKLKNEKANNILIKQDINLIKEKELDIKFYSQFPLDISTGFKYEEPYQNFCEEASLLNGYYYLTGKDPNIEKYKNDLLKLKEIEDLIFDGGYKHTSLQDTLKLLIAFQNDKQEIFGEIIENPSIEEIKENIILGNLIIVPVYGKGLSNPLFLGGGPIYHNLLIKGFKDEIFIVNEVGISKGDGYKYKIKELMENIYNYDEKLYPDNFTKGKKEILILYK